MKREEMLLDAIGDIREDFIADAQGGRRVRRFGGRRTLVLAAALVLCMGMALTAFAAADGTLYRLFPDVAERLIPVHRVDVEDGIRMEVISAVVKDDVAEIYISLQDMEQDRFGTGLGAYKATFGVSGTGEFGTFVDREYIPVGYDPLNREATELIRLTWDEGGAPVGRKCLLSVQDVFGGAQQFEGILPVDWTDVEADPLTRQIDGYISFTGGEQIDEADVFAAKYLQPGETVALVDGIGVSGIGYVGDVLHVQVRIDGGAEFTKNQAQAFTQLTDAQDQRIVPQMIVEYGDAEGDLYIEYFYDVAPEKLQECTLQGEYRYSIASIPGNWNVSFLLKEAK